MEIDNYPGDIMRSLLQLEALCLKEVPTVGNWKKTTMSGYVVRHVNSKQYPKELCNIIRKEYPEWFI